MIVWHELWLLSRPGKKQLWRLVLLTPNPPPNEADDAQGICTPIDIRTIGQHLKGIDEMPLLLLRTESGLAEAIIPVYNIISSPEAVPHCWRRAGPAAYLTFDPMLLRLLNDYLLLLLRHNDIIPKGPGTVNILIKLLH